MDCGPEAAVFDKAKVLERLAGDQKLLKEISGLFLETCPQLMADTRAALISGDHNALARSAHALKGSLGNFAAKDAYEAAVKLEQAARQGDLKRVQETWAELAVEVDRLRSALGRVAKSHASADRTA